MFQTKKYLLKAIKICLLVHNSNKEELEKERNGMPVINIYNHGESHYTFFSFDVETKELVEEEQKADINQLSKVSIKSDNPCPELFDPCTREPMLREIPHVSGGLVALAIYLEVQSKTRIQSLEDL